MCIEVGILEYLRVVLVHGLLKSETETENVLLNKLPYHKLPYRIQSHSPSSILFQPTQLPFSKPRHRLMSFGVLCDMPDLIMDNASEAEESFEDEELLAECLDILNFPKETINEFYNIPGIKSSDGTVIPAAYVRDRIPALGLRPSTSPDFMFCISSGNSLMRSTERHMMHDIIWKVQCTTACVAQEVPLSIPVCNMAIPSTEGLRAFMDWLYTNDEQSLYDHLSHGNADSPRFTINFCHLVRRFGCVNHKIVGVVRALYG